MRNNRINIVHFQRRPRPLYIFGLEILQNLDCDKGPPVQWTYIYRKMCKTMILVPQCDPSQNYDEIQDLSVVKNVFSENKKILLHFLHI